MKNRWFVPVMIILFSPGLFAQDPPDTAKSVKKDLSHCTPQSLGSLFRKKDQPPKPPKDFTALVLPNISSNPSNGFLLGVGGSLGWWFGPKQTTRISGLGFTAAWTTRNQWIFFIKSNSYTKNDRFFLQGDWRFYIYSQPTYGLGTSAPPDSVEMDPAWSWLAAPTDESGGYPLEFNYFKFHEIVSYKIKTGFYGGLGFHLDNYSDIVDKNLVIDSVSNNYDLTPHWAYSYNYGFNPKGYTNSGLSLNFVYDSRDNLISPYKGIFFNLNLRQNMTWMGSDRNSTFLFFDLRYYKGLSKRLPRHLIGGWLWGNFMVAGRAPYLTLQSIGDDQRARSGRGYIQGRFRGENFLYGEIEYRFPISQCSQILGGVVFLNAATCSSSLNGEKLFDHVAPGFGVGLRVMINATSRTNMNLEYGMGEKSKGFYFSGAETF